MIYVLPTFLVLFLLCCWGLVGRRASRPPLPPGPTIFSSLIASNNDFKTFQKWTQKYGPVVSAKIGTRTYIILGTRQAAQDLLDKRGHIYSSRPASVFLDKYLSKGLAPAFMPYGHEWRLNRRLYSSLLNTRAVHAYRAVQDIQSKLLLQNFLSCNDFSDIFHHYTSDVMFTLVYGKGRGKDDEDRRRLDQINEMATFILQGTSFGAVLLDLFPIFDHLPGFLMKWRKQAVGLHDKTKQVYVECFNSALQADCWNWSHETRQKKEVMELPWEHVCYSLGELYVAGVHTSKMVLENFVVACLLYPDVLNKARGELDAVVGPGRLPTFDDMDRLPYINALISELLRWRPISPIAVPHAVINDDEYMNYFIPRGSIVIGNQFGMNMDEYVFDEPAAFRPERYMDNHDLPVSAFGFGRRACPGYRMALSTLYIVISRVLWTYDIACVGEQPNEASNAASIKTVFQLRSCGHRKVVEHELDMIDKDEKRILGNIRDNMRGTKA